MLGGSRAFIPLVGPLPFIHIHYLPTAIHGKTDGELTISLPFKTELAG